MGHVRVRLVPAGTMPRDAALGVRMRRLLPGETEDGRGRRTFGPPDIGGCVAAWDSWSVQTDPDPIVLGSPFDYYIWPTTASVLCDGDCLEWALSLTGGVGPEPNVTIEAGADCVGVIVHVDGTAESLLGWTINLTATLNGSPFGDQVSLNPNPVCSPECAGVTLSSPTYPESLPVFPDPAYEIDVTINGELCDLTNADIQWIYGWNGPAEGFGWSMTPLLDPGKFRFSIYTEGGSAAGTSIEWTPQIFDGAWFNLCAPFTIYCEVFP